MALADKRMSVAMRLGEAWRQACRRIDRLDARLLLEHVCGCSHADLIARPELEITESRATRLEELLRRRGSGEPLAYLLGSAWFCGLEFNVGPAVLIPRPDTEVLVNVAAEKAIALESPAIVSLGTGVGIVAILIARLCPQAQVTAVDVSSVALDVARVNAQRHGVNIRFREGDWYVMAWRRAFRPHCLESAVCGCRRSPSATERPAFRADPGADRWHRRRRRAGVHPPPH